VRYGLLEPVRSAGGFRLYSSADEERVRRMRSYQEQGLSAAEAARQVLAAGPVAEDRGPVVADLAEELRATLDRFDEDGANRAIDRLLGAVSVESVLQEVLLPYLRILGDRWASGEVSVAQEHFASSLVRGRLLGLARGWGAGAGPALVLACPPGEEHDLGLIMFGIAAARRGYRIIYLGQDTPFETIEQAVGSVRPALVVLGVAAGASLVPQADALRTLAARVPVAIGGSLAEGEPPGVRILEGDPVEAARSLDLG
ncbi:MAG TPA: cobalamin B12-binding domain-containing protein, partial [Actinomycetota bacterium]|nr:cobalamin B12-binding domain-containing protein [Actinomycetota bacterium]